jgi:hypothetical protein
MKKLGVLGLLLATACGTGDDNVAPPPVSVSQATAPSQDASAPSQDAAASTVALSCSICDLACLTGQSCDTNLSPAPGPGQTEMFFTGASSKATFSVTSTRITQPPWHGICFIKSGMSAPSWCDVLKPSAGVQEAAQAPNIVTVDAKTCSQTTVQSPVQEDMTGDLINVNATASDGTALQGLSVTACYLSGTLDHGEGGPDPNSDCMNAGSYCCFPPHSIGDTVAIGHVGDPTMTNVYVVGVQSLPDVSTAGPHPFRHWRTPTWDTSNLPSRACSIIVDDPTMP